MEDETTLEPIEQRDVDFYGDVITAVLVEADGRETVYIPLRPVCDYLGVSWAGQRERVNRDAVLSEVVRGVRVTRTPGVGGGTQEMLSIPLDYLNGWLFGMNASRVKEEVREQLIRYQRECYRVLADAFLGPGVSIQATRASDEPLVQLHNMALVIAATTKEMLATKQLALSNQERLDQAASVVGDLRKRVKSIEQRLQVGTLTEEQAAEIRQRVNAIANEIVKHEPGKTHYQAVYAALGDEVGVTSYKNIPQKGYDGAIAFLDNWLLSLRQLRQNE